MKLRKILSLITAVSLFVLVSIPTRVLALQSQTSAKIPVTVYMNAEMVKGTEFEVKLSALDKDAPLPKETTLKAVASGMTQEKLTFGDIIYTKPGVYYYSLVQTKGHAKNVTYDPVRYTVMVSVENQNDENGNWQGLKAGISGWKGGLNDKTAPSGKLSEFAFNNRYKSPQTNPNKPRIQPESMTKRKIVKTGDTTPIMFWLSMFLIAGLICVILFTAGRKRRVE